MNTHTQDVVEGGALSSNRTRLCLMALVVLVSLVAAATYARASTPSYLDRHGLDHVKITATVTDKDSVTGKVLSTKVYSLGNFKHAQTVDPAMVQKTIGGDDSKDKSGTGGTRKSGTGERKVTITQYGYSILGAKLWTWRTWVDWKWWCSASLPCPGLQVVAVQDKGVFWDVNDNSWGHVAGLADSDQGYYDSGANNGWPQSAYFFMRQGEFYGPALGGIIAHEYPKNLQRVYYDSTDYWRVTCC